VKRIIYILLALFVITFVVTMSAPSFSQATTEEEERELCTQTSSAGEDIESVASCLSDASGIVSEAPQVPQTVPVRRIVTTTTSSGFSLSRIIRLCHNLSMRQLALHADRLLASLCSTRNNVFTGAPSPNNVTRACEYYVYALRMIVI